MTTLVLWILCILAVVSSTSVWDTDHFEQDLISQFGDGGSFTHSQLDDLLLDLRMLCNDDHDHLTHNAAECFLETNVTGCLQDTVISLSDAH